MTGSCENHHETIVFDVVTHHTDTLGTRVPNVMGYLKNGCSMKVFPGTPSYLELRLGRSKYDGLLPRIYVLLFFA